MNNPSRFSVQKKLSWKECFKAALLFFGLNFAISLVFIMLGLQDFYGSNASAEANSWIEKPYLFALGLVTIMPILAFVEEFLFRYIPYRLSQALNNRFYWAFGFISSFLFAWIHDPLMFQRYAGWPIPQFLLGLFLWRFIPGGLANTFWIHFFFNIILGIIFHLVSLIAPQ